MNPDSHMEPDNYRQAWQAQSSQTRVTIDTDLLLKEVQRNQRDFRATIFRRDFIEIGVALFLLPYWFYAGITRSLPWTWYLTVPALVWVAGFLLVDRMRHKQKPSEPSEPLLESVKESLTQVEHQIWLLHNVFWWYLLPPTISILAFFAHVTWLTSEDWLDALSHAPVFVFLLAVYSFIYYLNQRGVRLELEPRRQELLALLTSLGNETSSEESAVMNSAEGVKTLGIHRHPISVMVLLVTLAALGSAAAVFVSPAAQYPKRAPFTGVRWEGGTPVVEIGEEWFTLVSLDGIAAEDIVAFSRRTYWFNWRKRFDEDLVEVLTRMGHEPGDSVRLVVRPLGSSTTRTLEDVPMTEANRWAIRAGEMLDSSYDQPPRSSGPAGDSLARLITDLRKEKNLVGLAAMVMIHGQVEAAAAHGERKNGSDVPLEIGDRWHLGGITKSITATMIARLVESGQMQWSDTIGEIFPEASVHEDWKPVTLKQLLTDTAGAPTNFPREVSRNRPPLGPESNQARREAVLNVIADNPAFPPGEKYAYSNVGYTIAGAMAEKATSANWEDLVKREIFEPLKLTEAGFGPPKSADDTLEQPRGHRARLAVKVPVDDDADNTSIMGPAGIVHMSLRDLCTYATEHLRGDFGAGQLLSAETYKLLHAPELDHYACGWLKKEPRAKTFPTVYWHNGSNTMWYALVVFIPEKNMVVAVTSNDGDIAKAEAAAWEVVNANAPTDYPKKSPFAGVRWHESQPEVRLGDDWFKLVSLDELPASEIVAFSQRTYGNKWQNRFEEDLVEVLTRMGHPPQDTVTLDVQSLTSSETWVREDVPMTEENRRAIRAAAQTRSFPEP